MTEKKVRDKLDEIFRPTVHPLYDTPSLVEITPIAIPEFNYSIIHAEGGIRYDQVDDIYPDLAEVIESRQKQVSNWDALTPYHRTQIKMWTDLCGQYGFPGFTKPKTYVDHLFEKPTNVEIGESLKCTFDLCSEAIPKPVVKEELDRDQLLEALALGRKMYWTEKLRAEGKEEEAAALESEEYDVYKPEKIPEVPVVEREICPMLPIMMRQLPDKTKVESRRLIESPNVVIPDLPEKK